MTITVDAVYENGVLKPTQPLPLREHSTIQLTIEMGNGVSPVAIVRCDDPALIEWAALDPDLAYPEPRDTP